MSDDIMPNDDLNEPNTPEDFDALSDLSGVNPMENSPVSGMPEGEIPVGSPAASYSFDEMQGEAVNEVKIEEEINSDPVTVRPVEFTQFDSYTPTNTDTNKNLELLMDIKLELTVELGRCQLPVKKVLELTRGSIIELDKVAGESVELYANGKHVANGEVVVIEDNFGLRITSITDPEERIKSL